MMMSDYMLHPYHLSGSSAMSTLSSETMSGSATSSSRHSKQVRTVRLIRPNTSALPPPGLSGCRHGPNLGFSIRGGREHGTGIFISHVELGSEAHRQGLKVGDQIVRINGFAVDDAVHKEVFQLISNHTHLTLKLRNVGIIPVKDKRSDPLSWQIVSDCNSTSSTRSSPQLSESNHEVVRMSINVAPRAKLGCGICKGPEWKPGIFIQFTKDGGIAREAGLRPGDQILTCNGVDFADIAFTDAVTLMKSARQLDLVVRKAAGAELFPGESSGYNSSASSVTGDQSPSWSESKRLSIVKEESTTDLEDRLAHLRVSNAKKWAKIEWDDADNYYQPTIINLSEHGTTITNNGTREECKDDEFTDHRNADVQTVVVEIHQTDEMHANPIRTPSIRSFSSSETSQGNPTTSSLSSAISQELLRRSEKKKKTNNNEEKTLSIDEQLQMKRNVMKNVDTDKQVQHHKLMDEFRQAHKKMFKSNDSEQVVQDRMNGTYPEFTQKVTDRLIDIVPRKISPPPPPPLPLINGQITSSEKNVVKTKAKPPPPPVPIKTSTLSFHQPPPCPTPDYDSLSLTSNSTLPRKKHTPCEDRVEMESMDSFGIQHPQPSIPKPPAIYFCNGDSPKKLPSNVTIREYGGAQRKVPGKFDFLAGSSTQGGCEVDASTQLQSELAHTLNRSNLRRRADSTENILNNSQITRDDANGSVRISVKNGGVSRSHVASISKALSNRVKINIAPDGRKLDAVPNGILKNGNAANANHTSNNGNHLPHRSLVHQKSITFGEMPTVIQDHPLHVS